MAMTQGHVPPAVIHYGPGEGDRPLCGEDSWTAVYSDDPGQVAGCEECLELVLDDQQDLNAHCGHCLHCRQEITAQGGVEWRRVVSGAHARTAAARVGEHDNLIGRLAGDPESRRPGGLGATHGAPRP